MHERVSSAELSLGIEKDGKFRTPIGFVARVFFVGVMLEKWRTANATMARVADRRGAVTVVAPKNSQAHFALSKAKVPCYVAVSGKVRANRDGATIVAFSAGEVGEKERQLWEEEVLARLVELERVATDEETRQLCRRLLDG